MKLPWEECPEREGPMRRILEGIAGRDRLVTVRAYLGEDGLSWGDVGLLCLHGYIDNPNQSGFVLTKEGKQLLAKLRERP